MPIDDLITSLPLFQLMAMYVSKVTSRGRVTVPRELREELGLSSEDHVEFILLGEDVFIRKLTAERKAVRVIRAKMKRIGMTRERANEIVEEVREGIWKEHWNDPHD